MEALKFSEGSSTPGLIQTSSTCDNDDSFHVTVKDFLNTRLPKKTSKLPLGHHATISCQSEQDELGKSIMEVSMDWKRILSPMISYELVQDALILYLRESKRVVERELAAVLLTYPKSIFQTLLSDMKALPESIRNKLRQRNQLWIDRFREQVDYTAGDGKGKRFVDVHELADILTFGNEIKTAGNASFQEHDFGLAVTRYVQIGNILKDVQAVRAEENAMIDELNFVANRNLTLAALKNWEWGRAKRACDMVIAKANNDHVVRYRRAEANRQLGCFESSYEDISYILQADPAASDIILKKTKEMKSLMRQVERECANELRRPIANGLVSGIFSSDRSSENAVDGIEKCEEETPRFRDLRERIHLHTSNLSTTKIKSRSGVSNTGGDAINLRSTHRLLKLSVVEEIQTKQFELFNTPCVLRLLEKMRMDADLEQDRFLHRLKPFKAEVQHELLLEYGFEPNQEGLSAMERAIAAHMGECKKIGERGKALMIQIMGDIWEAHQ